MAVCALGVSPVLAESAAKAAAAATTKLPAEPHGHQGKLKPYPRPPPPLVLAAAEEQTLAAGKVVMRQTEGEAGGRGLAVFMVDAPPDIVWRTINSFDSYPRWIPEVKRCDVYGRDGGTIDVAFTLKSFAVSVDYYIRHRYNHAERWGTWTLDYTKNSDLDDSVGFWRVTPVTGADGKERSRVEYSVDIALKGWVPGFVRSILVDNGLKQATAWVKVQSEKRAAGK